MEFLGMGWLEIFMIAIVALIVLGPERLPAYARKAGHFIRQFRKITSGITKEVNKALELDEWDGGDGIKKELQEISKSLEEDATLLRKSLSGEAASLQETVNKGVAEVEKSLTQGSNDIMSSLNSTAESVKKNLSEEVAKTEEILRMPVDQSDQTITSSSPDGMVEYKPPTPLEDV